MIIIRQPTTLQARYATTLDTETNSPSVVTGLTTVRLRVLNWTWRDHFDNLSLMHVGFHRRQKCGHFDAGQNNVFLPVRTEPGSPQRRFWSDWPEARTTIMITTSFSKRLSLYYVWVSRRITCHSLDDGENNVYQPGRTETGSSQCRFCLDVSAIWTIRISTTSQIQ